MYKNFMISSAGRRAELVQIFREIANRRDEGALVCATDVSPLTPAGRIADSLDLVPRATDPRFIDSLLQICEGREIRHLIPTIDTELPPLAKHRRRFEAAGIEVWVSDSQAVDIAQDKRKTNSWLRRNSIPVCDQWELAEVTHATPLPYPLIAKPARGSSSVGITTVCSPIEIERLDPSLDYVLETIAKGNEYTVDVLVTPGGDIAGTVPRRRIETRGGEVSKGVTVRDEQLCDIAKRVAQSLPGARGILNVQIMKDEIDHSAKVIEVNARLGGGFPLSWAAGAHFPAVFADMLDSIPPKPLPAWEDNLVMLRYDRSVFIDGSRVLP